MAKKLRDQFKEAKENLCTADELRKLDKWMQKTAYALKENIVQKIENVSKGQDLTSKILFSLEDVFLAEHLFKEDVLKSLDGYKALQAVCAAKDVDMAVHLRLYDVHQDKKAPAIIELSMDTPYEESSFSFNDVPSVDFKKKKASVKTDKQIGIYPGTFDPITKGHLEIISRGAKLVDHLILAVANNPEKNPLFSIEERVAMMEEEIKNNEALRGLSIEVVPFNDLLVRFADQQQAQVIIRGLRSSTDFEYEFQMTAMNASLNDHVETVFLMAQGEHQFVSSSMVKAVKKYNGPVSHLVTPNVKKALDKKFKPSQ